MKQTCPECPRKTEVSSLALAYVYGVITVILILQWNGWTLNF